MLDATVSQSVRPRNVWAPQKPSLQRIAKLVSQVENVPLHLLFTRERGKNSFIEIRHMARYIACKTSGKNLTTISRFFKNDRRLIARIKNRIDRERQSNPQLDARLTWYEKQLGV